MSTARTIIHWVSTPVRWLWRLSVALSALTDCIRVAAGRGPYVRRSSTDMRDDFDWPFRDKANPPIRKLSPLPTEMSQTLTNAKVGAKLENSATRPTKQNRRRSATVTDSTTTTRSPMTPAVRSTRKPKPAAAAKSGTAAKKPAAKRKAASKPAETAGHTEGVTLKLVQSPSGKGGYRYDDSHLFGDDNKLDRTTMYLSQATIKAIFNGKAPKEIVFGA